MHRQNPPFMAGTSANEKCFYLVISELLLNDVKSLNFYTSPSHRLLSRGWRPTGGYSLRERWNAECGAESSWRHDQFVLWPQREHCANFEDRFCTVPVLQLNSAASREQRSCPIVDASTTNNNAESSNNDGSKQQEGTKMPLQSPTKILDALHHPGKIFPHVRRPLVRSTSG